MWRSQRATKLNATNCWLQRTPPWCSQLPKWHVTRPNQGLSWVALGGGKMRDPGNVWRSIPAKIQCSILRSTFRILSYICCLTSEFALSSFNFPRATFKFLPSTFNYSYSRYSSSRSSSAGCTFKFSHSTLSICHSSFCFEHLTLRISLASLHCTFNFLNCTFIRWSSSYEHRGLNWPSPPPLRLRSKDFPQESGRETFSSPDSIRGTSCQTWRITSRLRFLHSPRRWRRPRLVWVTLEPLCWEWLIAFPL